MNLLNKLPIKYKLIVLNSVTSLLVLLIAGIAFYVFERASYLDSVKADIDTLAAIAAGNSKAAVAFNDSKAASETLAALKEKDNIVAAAIYGRNNTLFATWTRDGTMWNFPAAPELNKRAHTSNYISTFLPITLEKDRIGAIYLVSDLSTYYERLRMIAMVIGAVVVFAALLALLLSAQLQKVISTPILTLAGTATKVSQSRDYDIRAAKTSNDELGFLIDRFNEMLAQIQERDLRLHDARVELESRVVERTTEIQNLNESLTQRASQLESANQELESFSYSVSHDLRAPLRHISGFIELLVKSLPGKLDPTSQEHLEEIQSSVREAGKLIDDLLAFSRMSRSEMQLQPVDMAELVDEVRRDRMPDAAGRDVKLTVSAMADVNGDISMLRLVWQNLISNAIKYTRTRSSAIIDIGAREDDNEVVFYIKDNGVGFDMKYVGRLFGVFHRLHGSDFEGTGIGLANVRRIIARHGGRTWAEGKLNEGATFYFSLPRKKQGMKHAGA